MSGIERIAAERKRQVEELGYDAERDDGYTLGELADAAGCYAALASTLVIYGPSNAVHAETVESATDWPWDDARWKPKIDPIDDLVIAGALIAAEIDRLERRS